MSRKENKLAAEECILGWSSSEYESRQKRFLEYAEALPDGKDKAEFIKWINDGMDHGFVFEDELSEENDKKHIEKEDTK